MVLTWLIIIIILSFLEAITVNVVSIWFIVSGIVAMLLSFFIEDLLIQFAVFVILGLILLLTTRKLVTRLLKTDNVKTNFDRIVGMTGIVTEKIEKNKLGEIKVDGKKWSAEANETIEIGEIVKVLKINSTKVIVEKEK